MKRITAVLTALLAALAGLTVATLPRGTASASSPPAQVPLPASGVTLPQPLALPTLPGFGSTGSLRTFIGHPAHAHPLRGFHAPARNPFMARNGLSNLHDDAYQTNAYPGAGPSGAHLALRSAYLQQECASLTFDHRGQIVTVCVGAVGETLDVFQAGSLHLLATYPLPTEAKVGVGSLTGGATSSTFGGGGYFYLDNRDRAVVPTVDGRIAVLAISHAARPAITLDKVYDLAPTIGSEAIESALPDWKGNLWFVTTAGTVGIANPSGVGAHVVHLVTPKHAVSNAGQPEKIGNSFAIDESGGVFVVSEEAMYRFDATANGRPRITWRQSYNRGHRLKPGQVNLGSGTTPTLIDPARSRHGGLVAILDNADPAMHVDVFPRARHGSHEPVCRVAVFTHHPRRNSDENNLISLGSRLWAENNYGKPGPITVTNTTPGMQEVKLSRHRGCHRVWESNKVRVPSVVSKVSARSGLLYTYTHPYQPANGPEAWYVTAVNARTGHVVWRRLAGVGPDYNNFYAPVTLGPHGELYVGTVGGIVELSGPLAGRKTR
jgi:outer membrane protein assembly factor BamB